MNITYEKPNPADSLLIPDSLADSSKPAELRYRINFSSPLFTEFEKKQLMQYTSTANNTIDHLETVAKPYGGEGYYSSGVSSIPGAPFQSLILDNKELFSGEQNQANSNPDLSIYGYATNAVRNSSYQLEDDALLKRYITKKDDSLKGIPVVISTQEAAKLFGKKFGIEEEPPTDEKQKTEWLNQLKNKLTSQTYQTCYRNQPEQLMLAKIQQDYAEAELNKDNKNYVKPNISYNYPKTPCGDIVVSSDTRTADEKKIEAEQIKDQKLLGTYQEPKHRLITYEIVGLYEADKTNSAAVSTSDYIKSLLSYHADLMSALVPSQLYNQAVSQQNLNDIFDTNHDAAYAAAIEKISPRVIAFPSIDDAKKFISNETCPSSQISCDKLFRSSVYGSNYLLLDDLGKRFNDVIQTAIPSVSALAIVIIWLVISRIMSESRRETATYRAMGALRSEIAAIYATYAMLLSAIIMALSLAVGLFAAYVIDKIYGGALSQAASSVFGGDTQITFNLFAVDSSSLSNILLIMGLILSVCLASSVYPIIRNVNRQPAKDLGDN